MGTRREAVFLGACVCSTPFFSWSLCHKQQTLLLSSCSGTKSRRRRRRHTTPSLVSKRKKALTGELRAGGGKRTCAVRRALYKKQKPKRAAEGERTHPTEHALD